MNTFLFIIMLILSFSSSAILLNETGNDLNKSRKPGKLMSNVQSISRGIAVFLIFIGVSSAVNLIDFGVYSQGFFLLGLLPALCLLLCELNKRRKMPIYAASIKFIIIAAVAELTIFSLPTYRILFGNYSEMDFTANQCSCSDNIVYRQKENDIVVKGSKSAVFTFENVNIPIANVFVDTNFEYNSNGALVSIDAMDETQTTIYRTAVGKGTLAKNKLLSQFIPLELSGKVSSIKITVSPLSEGIIYINGIYFNSQPPLDISWLRFFLFSITASFIWYVMKSKAAQKSFGSNKTVCRNAAAAITVIACAASISVSTLKLGETKWIDLLKKEEGNQVSQELVEAFEHGSTSLLELPTEDVLNFDNPYDKAYREDNCLNIHWDHVFYEGKYYSYYGIAPVILLFLPYHKLTGYFFPDEAAVMLFSIIGIIGLTFLFMEYMKKFFPKTPTGLAISALAIIQTVSGIWFSIGRPMFYEVAMSAGFAFLTWAVYFMFSANIIGKDKPRFARTAVSSLLFAVAVLSRPTLVLYCICAAFFMLLALPRATASPAKSAKKKLFTASGIRYIVCAILPMACLGMVQMWYNYDRFGSPFEFGIQYSLTINNFTTAEFHPRLSWLAIYNYLFNPPVFSGSYPFISTNFQFFDTNGFFYEDRVSTLNSSGLFFLALPMFSFLLSAKALKKLKDKKKKILSLVYIGIPCILIPLGIIASVWESGYAVRYMVDFSWQSLLGAFAVFFWLYEKNEDKTIKRFASIFMCFSLVWALLVSGTQSFNQAFRFDAYNNTFVGIAYEVEQFFSFLK